MARFEHDSHALWFEYTLQFAGDLLRQAFLYLQPAGEDID